MDKLAVAKIVLERIEHRIKSLSEIFESSKDIIAATPDTADGFAEILSNRLDTMVQNTIAIDFLGEIAYLSRNTEFKGRDYASGTEETAIIWLEAIIKRANTRITTAIVDSAQNDGDSFRRLTRKYAPSVMQSQINFVETCISSAESKILSTYPQP